MRKLVAAVFISSLTLSAFAEMHRPWNQFNNPDRFSHSTQKKLSKLPTSGEINEGATWSGYYWPHKWGSIALRWKGVEDYENVSLKKTPFKYELPTKEKFAKMSKAKRNALSPAEKYDIYMGRFDFPTVKALVEMTNPEDPIWYGICEGWTRASINFNEPNRIKVKTQLGELKFEASDVKALLSFHESHFNQGGFASLGQRCEEGLEDECWDTNPASFHIAATNYVGILNRSFALDVDSTPEVWNQPIHSFKSTITDKEGEISEKAAPGTVKEVIVKTTMKYVVEKTPYKKKFGKAAVNSSEYEYTLELNANGEIIGGEWISQDRPDYLFIPNGGDFSRSGYYSKISELYKMSQE